VKDWTETDKLAFAVLVLGSLVSFLLGVVVVLVTAL
jgi:hypothetical protein